MTTTQQVTTNEEQRLYVIPCNRGYSCLGFDVLIRRTNETAAWLRNNGIQVEDVPESLIGTVEAYAQYEAIMQAGSELNRTTGKRCPAELIPEFIGREGQRVEVTDAYGETRRFYIGKSTGWRPCHLEIARRDSSGGGSVTGYPFKSLRFIGKSR